MGKKEPVMKYVLNTKNDDVFCHTDILAARPDMFTFSGTLTEAKERAKQIVENGKALQPAPWDEKDSEETPENVVDRIENVVAAIASLDPANPEQYTAMGVPRTGAIESIMGDDVSAEERDEAFTIYSEQKGQ